MECHRSLNDMIYDGTEYGSSENKCVRLLSSSIDLIARTAIIDHLIDEITSNHNSRNVVLFFLL